VLLFGIYGLVKAERGGRQFSFLVTFAHGVRLALVLRFVARAAIVVLMAIAAAYYGLSIAAQRLPGPTRQVDAQATRLEPRRYGRSPCRSWVGFQSTELGDELVCISYIGTTSPEPGDHVRLTVRRNFAGEAVDALRIVEPSTAPR